MDQCIKDLEYAFISRNITRCIALKETVLNLSCHESIPTLREQFHEEQQFLVHVVEDIISLLNGEHVNISQHQYWGNFTVKNMLIISESLFASDPSTLTSWPDKIQELTVEYIIDQPSEISESIACLHLLVVGVCYLEIFLQMNYTGPELSQVHAQLYDREHLYKHYLTMLECDGSYAFPLMQLPVTLIIARAILSTLSHSIDALWQHGILLDAQGRLQSKENTLSSTDIVSTIISRSLTYHHWFHGRAAIIHLRALQKQIYTSMPTIWKQAKDSFTLTIDILSSADVNIELNTQVWLEWGLAYHFADYGDKGKAHFQKAKSIAGLEVKLTGALGKRTKYQQTDYAQLILVANSKLISSSSSSSSDVPAPKSSSTRHMKEKPKYDDDEPIAGGWQHAEWEMGRRLVGEVEGENTGEEAAVREVMLDSMDGGAEENILLEGGPQYTEIIDTGSSQLHPIDQTIILAMCLDVSNSNPMDGLTAEEMFPYIRRVLQLANNWMIHSTALLERSWLEYEKRRTFDRALLQIQALLDQHSTKLTIMQSTFKAIEESAPIQDRLMYLYDIVYPAQYELKRDLATRYLKCQVFMSALNLFKELEMWDEVVQCYQLMDKPQRAEMVVREQLKLGETPYMITALADLTKDEALYERAWVLSNGRYARAKRTLARICYDRGDFLACIQHLDLALTIQPLVATAWYLRGIASMQLQDWPKALESFVRCIQQDMEVAEAYANMGAIYMRLREYTKAYDSLKEALKHKGESWKISENLLNVCLALGRWKEAIAYMDRLLDMRSSSGRPIHKDELRHLIEVAAIEKEHDKEMAVTQPLAVVLEVFLKKVTTSLHVDADVWDILALFYEKFHHYRDQLDCRFKEVRTANQVVAWEKDKVKVQEITTACSKLVTLLQQKVVMDGATGVWTKADLYAAKSLIQSIVKKIYDEYYKLLIDSSIVPAVDQECQALKLLVTEIDTMYANNNYL